MSQRQQRRLRRNWRSSWSRRAVLVVGWTALLASVTFLVLFGVTTRPEALTAGGVAALVAVAASWIIPELKPKASAAIFRPLDPMRMRRRRPSLARQLLTLP